MAATDSSGFMTVAEAPFYKRVENIVNQIDDDGKIQTVAPGLKNLLQDILHDHQNPEEEMQADHISTLKRMLLMYKEAPEDNAYQEVLELYNKEEKERIEIFVDRDNQISEKEISDMDENFKPGPTLGIRDEIDKLLDVPAVHVSRNNANFTQVLEQDFNAKDPFRAFVTELDEYLRQEKQDVAVTVFKDAEFQNWGLNVTNKPRWTCIPTTVSAIQAIVKFAKKANMNVRCSGYRHSWAPVFGREGQILISALPLPEVSKLPNALAIQIKEPPPNDLQKIEIVDGPTRTAGNKLVRIGCAVTNERLRRWCVKDNEVSIPFNVILTETTVVGVNTPICHGAGLAHPTLSDIVRKIEYIDVNGELQDITDPEHLRAASGAFGLFGVITNITLEFVPMQYALMEPKKVPLMQAIPPPKSLPDSKIPSAIFIDASPKERAKWQADFENTALKNYYCEWFWFPYLDKAYINSWSVTKDPSGAREFPMWGKIALSFFGGVLMNVAQRATTLKFVGKLVKTVATSTSLISFSAMKLLPTTPVKTQLPNALHFQRSIQNTRVRDVEVEMPLQPRANDRTKIDFESVQRAWWDAILLAYEHETQAPMRMPLEMRIMGGSDVILAPQRYNKLGTCSIEALTLWSEREAWKGFAQKLIDVWTSYKDVDGKELRTRPHWAKEWEEYNVNGKPWIEKLRNEHYRDEIKEFKQVLTDIGKHHGWTLDEIQKRFSNDMLDKLIYSDPSPVVAKK